MVPVAADVPPAAEAPQQIAPAPSSPLPAASDPLTDAREAAQEHSTAAAAVYKFVLTGGPCAGKTTALSRMGDFFREKG